jgi:hypothetical protein
MLSLSRQKTLNNWELSLYPFFLFNILSKCYKGATLIGLITIALNNCTFEVQQHYTITVLKLC